MPLQISARFQKKFKNRRRRHSRKDNKRFQGTAVRARAALTCCGSYIYQAIIKAATPCSDSNVWPATSTGVSKAASICTNAPVVGSFCLENQDYRGSWQYHCFGCAESWKGSARYAAAAGSDSSSGLPTGFLNSGKKVVHEFGLLRSSGRCRIRRSYPWAT